MPEPAADVLQVLDDLGLEPVSFTPIGGFPRWARGRVTYRVDLADGAVVKVRRFVKTARPALATALVRALDDPRLPPPITFTGRVMVDPWIDGRSLDTGTVTSVQLHAAADLLADLHDRTTLPDRTFRRTGSTAPERAKARRRLADLHAAGLVDEHERTEFARRIECDLPERAARGIVHGDLCPANLVVIDPGGLVSIDNERVRIHFLDQDLARTWTRWAMTADEAAEFAARYHAHGRAPLARRTADAWRVCTVVKSASTLRHTPESGMRTARSLIERLLAHLDSPVVAP